MKIVIDISADLYEEIKSYKHSATRLEKAVQNGKLLDGLEIGIRCALCQNDMKSDTGCDGGCTVDEVDYKNVMKVLKNHLGV